MIRSLASLGKVYVAASLSLSGGEGCNSTTSGRLDEKKLVRREVRRIEMIATARASAPVTKMLRV